MVNGQWLMVNGQWSMVNGQWSEVRGNLLLESSLCLYSSPDKFCPLSFGFVIFPFTESPAGAEEIP
jgi:hypothetical protein